jgi:hypothetical protein
LFSHKLCCIRRHGENTDNGQKEGPCRYSIYLYGNFAIEQK